MKARTDARGFVLLAVLWIGGIISMIALAVSALARSEIRIIGDTTARVEARAAAEGAIHLAIYALLTRNAPVLPGREMSLTVGEAPVAVAWEDETGKIDLNAAPARLLIALFMTGGMDRTEATGLAARIEDWRDADFVRRPQGAEATDYERVEAGSPGNRLFMTVRELEQVLDFPVPLLGKIGNALTVHSGRENPELGVASSLVRKAAVQAGIPADADEEDIAPIPAIVTIRASVRIRQVRYALSAVVRLVPDAATPYRIVQVTETP